MKRIENMSMSFHGIRNDEVGAKLIGMPIRQSAAISGEKLTIPGRSGFLFAPSGYGPITIKQDLMVEDSGDLPNAVQWLSGSGKLIFGDDPDFYYDAMVLTPISLQSIMKRLTGQKLSVTFTCQPFRYEVHEFGGFQVSAQLKSANSRTYTGTFRGYGHVNSDPLVALTASAAGTVRLTVNDRMMIVTASANQTIYIDCDAGTAYTESGGDIAFAGGSIAVEDDWYELNPGSLSTANSVTIVSSANMTVTLKITPRWRYL